MHLIPGQLFRYQIHFATFAVVSVLLLGHLYMAFFHPATRDSITAMSSGLVDLDFLKKHHPGWLDELPETDTARLDVRES